EPLEAPARMGGDAAGPEQPFESVLLIAPAPPAALALGTVYVGGGNRPARFHLGEYLIDETALVGRPAREALVDLAVVVGAGAFHAPLQQRPGLDRQERCLVSPVLEQAALPA